MNSKKYIPIIIPVAGVLLVALYIMARLDFLLFHSLVEGWAMLVAVSIFIVAWNTRDLAEDDSLLFLGIGYLFVAVLTFFHTITYDGINILPNLGPDPPTQFWMAARYLETFTLVAATIMLAKQNKNYSLKKIALAYGFYTALAIVTILVYPIFPTCFEEGVGLTSFKIYSEYFLVFILGIFLYQLRQQEQLEAELKRYLSLAILMSIIAELFFTVYTDIYGISNFGGHIFYLISFYALYKAIVSKGLQKPHSLLYRNIEQAEANVRMVNNCFLSFGADHKSNIDSIVATTGKLLKADTALYNELKRGKLYIRNTWNAPPNLIKVDTAAGHLCEYVVKQGGYEPIVIEDLQNSRFAETDPSVKAYNLETYIGCPVQVEGEIVGVLCTLFTSPKKAATQSLEAMSTLAKALGIEIERKRFQAHIQEGLEKAKYLQSSLFPKSFPDIPGIEIAGDYQQTEEVSGDYYNLYLQDNKVVFLMVDVTGHGLDAALITVFVSSFFRREMELGELNSPLELLQRLHTDFQKQNFPDDYSLEVFLGFLCLETMELEYATAGAIRALQLSMSKFPQKLPDSHGMLINGVANPPVFGTNSIQLNSGEAIIVYTDGVDEPFMVAESEDGDQRINELLTSIFGLLSLEELIERILNDTLRDLDKDMPADDMAVLGIYSRLDFEVKKWTCQQEIELVDQVLGNVLEELSCLDIDLDMVYMAAYEALTNSVEHVDGEGEIEIQAYWTDKQLVISVFDAGSGFNWQKVLSEEVDLLSAQERGRGIELIKLSADRVTFNKEGNKIAMGWELASTQATFAK
ncbi:MASE3 domain-containing protein [Fuchsiella alkaliacetigena]|uniref:MASE3 domain-containing protein n=1 Tax=Fuchsiella alkaliacetigena TaxID=957042 RepID=UPI00200B45EE|nr:MASE3 domain-containing protein [Fuchsiella alkaliacetigena]MCK8824822.1 SpoIIE family protein phosphatase [Fuchsiella alkaliacetigena]